VTNDESWSAAIRVWNAILVLAMALAVIFTIARLTNSEPQNKKSPQVADPGSTH
jgi:hypothetical protein